MIEVLILELPYFNNQLLGLKSWFFSAMELGTVVMTFTMAYLCSQIKAVKKPAIKPIVSPVKKVIILSQPFSIFF